jgi:hypothetical protein
VHQLDLATAGQAARERERVPRREHCLGREVHFVGRREDADVPRRGHLPRRQEHAARQVEFAGDARHLRRRHHARIGKHRHLRAAERLSGKHVHGVKIGFHRGATSGLTRRQCTAVA